VFFLKELPTQQMLQNYGARFSGMDVDAVDAALRLLRRASLLMRELEAYFAARGTSQTRFLAMIMIDREPDQAGLLPSEIAGRLDVSRPVVTDTIKALERAGLLGSTRDGVDARAKRVSLTAEGRAALADLLPGYFKLIADFMARDAHGAP
jgi:DNA-binding MarR family transcriptional regulator